MLWKEVDLNARVVIYDVYHIPCFCVTGNLQINFHIIRNLNCSKEAYVRAPFWKENKAKRISFMVKSHRGHSTASTVPSAPCVHVCPFGTGDRSSDQTTSLSFSLLLSSGERAWKTSGIFPKDSVSVQDLIPFQRPHSWYLGLGFWHQSTGVAAPVHHSFLAVFFLVPNNTIWVHSGLFNHSFTHRHINCIKFCDLQ